MNTLSTTVLSRILKVLLVIIFIFGLLFTPFCHWFLYKFWDDLLAIASAYSNPVINHIRGDITSGFVYIAIVIEIYTLGIIMLCIVIQLIRICSCIERNEPFKNTTTKALKIIAVLSFVLVIIYIIKFIAFPSLPCLIIALSFIIVGMISSVFSQLFKKAVEYKEENDFTI